MPSAVGRPGLAPSANEISFVDDREGWFLQGFQPATGCQQQGYQLWHTADAGSTWTSVSVDLGGTVPGGPLFFACKRVIAFGDRLRGVVVAVARDTSPTMYRTADGGITWTSTRLAAPPDFQTDFEGYALEPGELRWFGSTILLETRATVPQRRFIYRSTDGGATWSHVASASVNGSLGFVTASRWLQIALPDSHEETTDTGATWHRFVSDYSQAAGVPPVVVFADASVGYATVRGSIQRTTDGGAHWTAIKTPGT